MQLASKMRYVAVQFEALLTDDLWKRNAGHANDMASLLFERVKGISGVQVTREVESNGVFAIIDATGIFNFLLPFLVVLCKDTPKYADKSIFTKGSTKYLPSLSKPISVLCQFARLFSFLIFSFACVCFFQIRPVYRFFLSILFSPDWLYGAEHLLSGLFYFFSVHKNGSFWPVSKLRFAALFW